MSEPVGKVIRVEWNSDTDELRVVLEITDPAFKKRVLHGKDFQDILTIQGKDVMVVASKTNEKRS